MYTHDARGRTAPKGKCIYIRQIPTCCVITNIFPTLYKPILACFLHQDASDSIFCLTQNSQNTTNLSWLQHKTFIYSPSLTLPILITLLACFYNSTKTTTNIQGI